MVLAAILAVGGWWASRDKGAAPANAMLTPAAPHPYSAQDRRMSVIVLPFENTSGDSTQDGLAAEITRDLTEALGRAGDVPVVPLMTAAAYRGKTTDLRASGRDHDVHFALTGNARSQDGRLIVSASIYETVGLRRAWGGRFERTDGSGALHAIVQVRYENFWQTAIDEESAPCVTAQTI